MKTFSEKVYEVASRIPKGKVATYGQIARLAGNTKASRAVGMCMSSNIDTKKVPCHRVVASTGELTGYAFGGVSVKQKILEREGVAFKNKKADLQQSQWQK
ncbi:MAG: MGMT family protein [Patescibacteria group bacterium]